jgi:glyoxylase-like metal-dependent hydrolase (beta-lactamase superfamily II)
MEVQLVEIEQEMPGFNGFLGAWVCRGALNLVVDVGPAHSAGKLIASLRAMGLGRVDLFLITHIHIDHSGGLADLLDAYPGAMAVCHEKAVPFLVEPERLWAGSRKVLGAVADAYGQPRAVPLERLIPHPEVKVPGLDILETPGHAAHHLSFDYGDRLFAGEAAGNYLDVDGEAYLRPPTPPRFFLHVFLESVDRLLALPDRTLCYGHFGQREGSRRRLADFREQLLRWEGIIGEEYGRGETDLVDRCIEALLERDPLLKAFHRMERDVQGRERMFMTNSVKGYLGYIGETTQGSRPTE